MSASDAPVRGNARLFFSRLVVLAGAVALGLGLQSVVADRLAEIQALAGVDVVRARGELATLLRIGGALLFGLTGVTGLSIVASSRRALRAERFPPPGVWSWGAAHIVSGPRARTYARFGVALGAVLLACSLAGGGLTWYMAAVLVACRAP
jgi:hypothetical protein